MEQKVVSNIGTILAASLTLYALVTGVFLISENRRPQATLAWLLAFIFGVLPLALSTGAGAGARQAVGVTVVGGMLAATVIGLFIIPTLFAVIQRLTETRVGPMLRSLRRPKRPHWAFSRRSRRPG